jgi:hypothetical protein
MTGVQFLPEEGADGTEDPDLPQPPQRIRPWWIVAALVLVVGATVWTLTRPSDHTAPKPQAAPTTQQSHLPISGPIGTSPTDRAVTACHGAPFCAASVIVPSDLRRVIRHYLPQIKSLTVRSYVGRTLTGGNSYLADRDINALAGSVSVLISLHRNYTPTSAPSAIVTAPAGVGSVVVHSMTPGFTIDLQYLAPETVPPALSKLRMLTLDPRLESL